MGFMFLKILGAGVFTDTIFGQVRTHLRGVSKKKKKKKKKKTIIYSLIHRDCRLRNYNYI